MVALSTARGMSSEKIEINFVLHLILIGISVNNNRINNVWKPFQISQIILLEELIPNTSFLSKIMNKICGSIIKQKENLGKNDHSEKQGASAYPEAQQDLFLGFILRNQFDVDTGMTFTWCYLSLQNVPMTLMLTKRAWRLSWCILATT